MQQSNERSKVLWIGDLDSWMDETYLQSLIHSLGYTKELVSVRLIKNKETGAQMKFGFLQFISHQAATNFYTNYNNRIIPNTTKQFKINWAQYNTLKSAPANPHKNSQQPTQQTQIYVGDLDYLVTDHKLLELFRMKYPSAFNAKIITDTITKLNKGYAFVKFREQEEAHRAITEMNGFVFMGKPLKVSTAHSNTKPETPAETEENQNQLLLRQKLYEQFYSSINDPQIKAEYERQVIKTFGGDDLKKETLKQSLSGIRSLSYAQTQESEKLLSVIPKSVSNRCRASIEERLYQ